MVFNNLDSVDRPILKRLLEKSLKEDLNIPVRGNDQKESGKQQEV